MEGTPVTNSHQCFADEEPQCDAVVVGAGFAGMYMLHKLKTLGFEAKGFEAGGDVGGTWYWNRYPGCRCDIPSMEYSYQFSDELQQEWHWTEKYSSQEEILRYLNHVADRFDLRKDIRFDTWVLRATWNDVTETWMVETDHGERVTARFCILATGSLSARNTPKLAGISDFRGKWYHTCRWPHEGVDFAKKRVGIVGTGSTGIQLIPMVAQEAGHLYIFQRTPQYTIPSHNRPLDPEEEARIKSDYRGYRARNHRNPFSLALSIPTVNTFDVSEAERLRRYEECWAAGGFHVFFTAFADSITNLAANKTIGEFIKGKIRSIVKDPEVAALLMPKNIYACKRPCLDTKYFETYNRPNVTVIDIGSKGLEKATPRGVVADGREYPLDFLIFATGYDAVTGSIKNIDIRGRHQVALADKWADGPRSYLGLSSAGFPNLFTITGPLSPSVHANMVPAIEQHVNWIGDCLAYLRRWGKSTIEAEEEAEDPWVMHVQKVASATLWPSCDNWYNGGNVPGKPRVFLSYLNWAGYVDKCKEVAKNSYEGFSLQ